MRHAEHISLFHKESNQFNNAGARMFDSVYHTTLKLIKNRFLA